MTKLCNNTFLFQWRKKSMFFLFDFFFFPIHNTVYRGIKNSTFFPIFREINFTKFFREINFTENFTFSQFLEHTVGYRGISSVVRTISEYFLCGHCTPLLRIFTHIFGRICPLFLYIL